MSAVLERRGTTGGPRGPVPVTARTRAVPAPPRLSRQLIRFAAIGAASTGAYLVLYLLLRPLGAQQANAIALLVTAIANTSANRRLTFAVRGPERLIRNQLQGLVVFAAGLAVTSGALALMHGLLADPGRLWEVAALVAANGMATLLRFVLLRTWVFDGRAGPA